MDLAAALDELPEVHATAIRLNRAGMDPMSNHIVQLTRADVVGPAVLEFLGRHPRGA